MWNSARVMKKLNIFKKKFVDVALCEGPQFNSWFNSKGQLSRKPRTYVTTPCFRNTDPVPESLPPTLTHPMDSRMPSRAQTVPHRAPHLLLSSVPCPRLSGRLRHEGGCETPAPLRLDLSAAHGHRPGALEGVAWRRRSARAASAVFPVGWGQEEQGCFVSFLCGPTASSAMT